VTNSLCKTISNLIHIVALIDFNFLLFRIFESIRVMNYPRPRKAIFAYITLIVVGAALFYAVSLIASLSSVQHNHPLVFDDTIVLLGNVKQNESIRVDAILQNTSNFDAVVKSIETSCHCTTAANLPKNITVKKQSTLPIGFNFQTGYSDGRVSSRVTLAASIDKEVHYAEFTIIGDVMPEYRIEPKFVDFGKMSDLSGESIDLSINPVIGSIGIG